MRTSDLPMPDVPVSGIPSGAGTQLTALAGFVATAAGYIPFFLALIPAVYYCFLIYETKTVQAWVERRRQRKATLKLAKLKAQTLVVGAQIDAAADVKVAQIQAAATVDNAAVDAQVLVAKTAAGVTGTTN